MSNIMRRAFYAGVGLYDKVREGMDDLVRRGERRRHDGEQSLTTKPGSAAVSQLTELEARVRQLEVEVHERVRREEEANELVEALAP